MIKISKRLRSYSKNNTDTLFRDRVYMLLADACVACHKKW